MILGRICIQFQIYVNIDNEELHIELSLSKDEFVGFVCTGFSISDIELYLPERMIIYDYLP